MFELIPFDRKMRYNPFNELAELERNLFGTKSSSYFSTDIKDDGNNYILESELPGFKKEDISIELDSNTLYITAYRNSSNDKENDGYIRKERHSGYLKRSFDISGINTENIKAEYKDGILKLILPKKETSAQSLKRLNIE